MFNVTKDGKTMAVRDEIQLAAFLNNGWEQVDGEKPEKAETPVVSATKTAEEGFTKEQLNAMSADELKELAEKNGVETDGKKFLAWKSELVKTLVKE